eukprot:gnl/TRDRNA2_/TRDRNA2_89960_c2_seq1.p1 gnl/TRDRNA2_/TRDRNA2_89960_c2~~gnl/TRDRNA2_/TRDRNA2_89960_c2_seq1.p1  ORF type:complete len:125 (-),score=1.49 gnl/TRDRNA2_/TRDRNA2_89960_c2_seq1:112-486(-)
MRMGRFQTGRPQTAVTRTFYPTLWSTTAAVSHWQPGAMYMVFSRLVTGTNLTVKCNKTSRIRSCQDHCPAWFQQQTLTLSDTFSQALITNNISKELKPPPWNSLGADDLGGSSCRYHSHHCIRS